MGAYSVTGTGPGSVEYYNNQQLTNIAIGPASIVYVGKVDTSNDIIISPPANLATVYFQNPLPDGSVNYSIFLTTVNGGSSQVVAFFEDGGLFTGFVCSSEFECTINYMVVRIGSR